MPDLIGLSRSGSLIDNSTGQRFVGNPDHQHRGRHRRRVLQHHADHLELVEHPQPVLDRRVASRAHRLDAAKLSESAARNDVALPDPAPVLRGGELDPLAVVAVGAVHLARDDERRRVRAMPTRSGRCLKSDLLAGSRSAARRARPARSTAAHQIADQSGSLLATRVGSCRRSVTLVCETRHRAGTLEPHTYDEAALLAEATSARAPTSGRPKPTLRAARGAHKAARGLAAAAIHQPIGVARLRPVVRSRPGRADFRVQPTASAPRARSAAHRMATCSTGHFCSAPEVSAQLGHRSISAAVDSRIASAGHLWPRCRRARTTISIRSRRPARARFSRRSPTLHRRQRSRNRGREARAWSRRPENLNLTQQKYNVGSATILDLIDAQVQLQTRGERPRSRRWPPSAWPRPQIDRVRGQAE